MPVVIAVIVLIALGVIALFAGALRRSGERALGELSRETVSRDRKARKDAARRSPVPAGRLVEKAAEIERIGTELVPASSVAPALWSAPDPDTIGVSRRQFLNRSAVGLMGFGVSVFGAASMVAFLWPVGVTGFGSKIRMGKIADLKSEIDKGGGFLYRPEARAWLTRYPDAALSKARVTYSAGELSGMEKGIVALYQKCPHLGCKVPSCNTSKWFECGCHGSQYNQVGEKKGGPAPRGMDRFELIIQGEDLVVNTGAIIQGPPIGTNTTGQEAEGAHCAGSAGGHH